jgi:hypothetical protein
MLCFIPTGIHAETAAGHRDLTLMLSSVVWLMLDPHIAVEIKHE